MFITLNVTGLLQHVQTRFVLEDGQKELKSKQEFVICHRWEY